MGYQSKTWSLSDEVVAEIERRVREMIESTGAGSPNRVLKEVLLPSSNAVVAQQPASRELPVELEEQE